jgi:hypothetical protein
MQIPSLVIITSSPILVSLIRPSPRYAVKYRAIVICYLVVVISNPTLRRCQPSKAEETSKHTSWLTFAYVPGAREECYKAHSTMEEM